MPARRPRPSVRRHGRPTPIRTLADLTPDPQNANRGTARGRRLLGDSLAHLGAGRSILTDRSGRVIAGNKTWERARALGLAVDVVQTDGSRLVVVQRTDLDLATDARARQLALADNRIAELDLDWDPAVLKQQLAAGVDLATLWSTEELERLFGEGTMPGRTDENATVAPGDTTIARGDLFTVGAHRVLCGDATDAADVDRLLASATPTLLVTDPPYGVRYDPAWRHAVDPTQRTAVGRVPNDDRVDWSAAYGHFQGPVAYVWHASVHAAAVATSLQAVGFDLRAQIIWRKQHFVMSRGDYHFAHEPCWYAVRRGQTAHWQGDRTQTTVWDVPNLNPMGGTRDGENAVTGHSTQKPVRLFERPILNHTHPGETIYDPFMGSGTLLIAAQKTGRTACVMDIEPRYVQAAITRWEAFTGQRAVRVRPTTRRRRAS